MARNDVAARECGARAAEVWARLARVDDPELDEAVTELGFVTAVEIGADGCVSIGFRLPTYWCATNFAFMMADDMRREVEALPWVTRVDLAIDAHMYGDAINRAMAEKLPFREAFPDQANDELGELRRIFAVKAFQRRQEKLLRALLEAGRAPHEVVSFTVADLAVLLEGENLPVLVARYRDRREVVGPVTPDAPAFVDVTGAPIAAENLASYPACLAAGHDQRRVQRRALPRPAGRALRRGGSDGVHRR